MEVSRPNSKSVYSNCIDSNSAKVISSEICPAKLEEGICTTASVHLDSIKPAKFRLLSLPIELRRMIYRYYFHNPLNTWKSKYRLIQKSKYCNIFCLKKCHTQILSVSHQLYDEAIESLYGDTIWHFSFNSFVSETARKTVRDTFLREFCSRPAFRFIQHISIGVMFLTVMNPSLGTLEDRSRLRINRKLLEKICNMLRRAPNLRTVKVLWHDSIKVGDWEKKQICLRSLAKLPEGVSCKVFLGRESPALHFPEIPISTRLALSTDEGLAKAELNEYLEAVRREYQANSPHKSPEGSEGTSTQNAIEHISV